jgi:hypoxanthine phosphoribosyltransferase
MEFEDVSGDIESVVLDAERIREGIARIARAIEKDHPNTTPLLIGVLKGAVMVMADLARELRTPIEMEWMAVSSYGQSTQSSGVVRIVKDLEISLEGRHVILVEDIVDTGQTIQAIRDILSLEKPKSLKVATLLYKRETFLGGDEPDYVGIEIPNEFVVGYGLDFDELGRNLEGIYKLKR